jgi:S1-C subfamily serine protease
MLEKWKRAVVHLECAASSESIDAHWKRNSIDRALLARGRITREQYAVRQRRGTRDLRFHGTALLLVHATRRYLLTARHVVCDVASATDNVSNEPRDRIYPIIFRVPSIDEIDSNWGDPAFLMNVGAGTKAFAPYTLSDPSIDLAIISLDQRHSSFADELENCGLAPIDSSDIGEQPDAEGDDIFTVGFPSATALIHSRGLYPGMETWSSNWASTPVFAFGKVSMIHKLLPFFWADMSIYPGNSGGPLVSKGRLVGIVSAQATVPIDGLRHAETRIPFGQIIKARFIGDLLATQQEKDRRPSSVPFPQEQRKPLARA